MDTPAIRKIFLDFFASRGHKIVPSSSLVPDDPTLLLTNAGMVQFKPYFLGEKPIAFPRAASVQKCFREIDLEEVGKTARHLTFFEMLGNFSFGDYFKRDACGWAWELMTTGYKLDPQRLWITVFEDDEEAAKIWEQDVGVPSQRILRRTRDEGNFWDMGVAGPCGPCSELLYDRGEEFGRAYTPGSLDEERYLEVWNLVFMQYVQDEKGQIVGNLPSQNVDTGMGLERLASILQGVSSNFEIDSMAPILQAAEQLTGRRYGQALDSDVGLRVLSEHARSMTFLIADGVLPGRTGRGYVLRRLIRRAVRYARLLGIEEQVLAPLTEVAIGLFAGAYPEVDARRELITKLVAREEAGFDETLRRGLSILEEEIRKAKAAGESMLPGDIVFKLQDTYGFPQDLTADIAADEDLTIDREGFDRLMGQQRTAARTARGAADKTAPQLQALSELLASEGKTHFSGYERLKLDAPVLGLVKDSESAEVLQGGSQGEVILAETPFYPEGGGQVGDRGDIRTASGTFEVETTRWGIPGVVVHRGKVVTGEIHLGEDAAAQVNPSHREGVTKAHSATHILHWALRDRLGEHARQQGSLVEPGRLRFDFSHFEPITAERLAEMEEELNRRVLWDDSVRAFETTFDYAVSIGAMALFGEKYGDYVRVVEVGEYSKELCGGTHVARTGQIGIIKLVHEGSVAAGTRRVEALTGLEGLAYLTSRAEKLQQVVEMLKTDPDRVVERLEKTLETMKQLRSEIAKQKSDREAQEVKEILASDAVKTAGGGKLIALLRQQAGVDELRRLAAALRQGAGSAVVIVGSVQQGKANLVAAVSRDLVEGGVSSNDVLQESKVIIGGGGGGKPDMAVAGGPKHSEIANALKAAEAAARKALEEPSRAGGG